MKSLALLAAVVVVLSAIPSIGHTQDPSNTMDPVHGWFSPLNPSSPLSIANPANRHDSTEAVPAPKPLTPAEQAAAKKAQDVNNKFFLFAIIFFPALISGGFIYLAIQQKRGRC